MESIRQLILNGQTEEAIRQLDEIIKEDSSNDKAYYLRGNAYRKTENIQMALNNYLTAMELNPDSPAHQAYAMLMNILNFYNKDLYNP